ncbi:MAG TPA: hypothetical protein VJ985_03275 [Gammaproteobacteria bacterium]|nr:hypothetical protein [Gammaproteobacteria bacterium]
MSHDPSYLLGVALGFTIVPYFILYMIYVLMTRRTIPILHLLGGMLVAIGVGYVAITLGAGWLEEDLLKTPVPMFSGVISAGAVISLLGKWKGRGRGDD